MFQITVCVDFTGILNIHGTKGPKDSENNPDDPMLTASKKQCSILQYVKRQLSEKMVSILAVSITISKKKKNYWGKFLKYRTTVAKKSYHQLQH